MNFLIRKKISRRSMLAAVAMLSLPLIASPSVADDDGPLVGVITWEPGTHADATMYDKTDYWCGIAVSPSTGKFAASCEWTNRDNADRQAREKCNAKDAKAVVLCANGWCALALGKREPGTDIGWGVGYGADQRTAEKFALEGAKQRKLPEAKIVFAINAREMRTGGAIAFSESTNTWGYGTGGTREAPFNALKRCKAADAKVVAKQFDCWMALALGDDKGVYGWGYAGNRIEAEANAMEDCSKRTTNSKIAVSFCTNGDEHN